MLVFKDYLFKLSYWLYFILNHSYVLRTHHSHQVKLEYKLYYIEWMDAMAYLPTWGDREEITEWANSNEGLVKQVGWIIEENENYILLSSRIGIINSDEPDFGSVFKIPSRWIKKRKEIDVTSSLSS